MINQFASGVILLLFITGLLWIYMFLKNASKRNIYAGGGFCIGLAFLWNAIINVQFFIIQQNTVTDDIMLNKYGLTMLYFVGTFIMSIPYWRHRVNH